MAEPYTVGSNSHPNMVARMWIAFWQLKWPYKAALIVACGAVLMGALFFVFWQPQMAPTSPTPPSVPQTTNSRSPQSTEGVTPGSGDTSTPQETTSSSTSGPQANTGGSSSNTTSGSTNDGSQNGGNGNGDGGGDTTPPGECPAFPAFPDASCTGWQHTGATLQECDIELTTNNGVYENCLFDGGLIVVGTNITVKKSKVSGIVSANWDANGSLRGLTLIDVEIDGSAYPDPIGPAAIGLDNYTCIRCDVHHTGRGANFRNNVWLEDSYFHDFVYVDGAHQSGVGSNGGSGSTIIHNNIECNGIGGSGCSGALVMYGDFDPVDDVLIQNNLLNTDGSFCTYAGSAGVSSGKTYPHGTNIRYLNNHFGRKYHTNCGDLGPVTAWENNSGNVWSGNVWADGSGTITPP